CDNDENTSTCPQDCPVQDPECGDTICESPEGCRDCPQDCGECPVGEDVIQAQDTITADDSGQTESDTVGVASGGCSSTGANGAGTGTAGLLLTVLLAMTSIIVRRSRRFA
ncbi:MAG TPA: MYXO-CTERM sorting domain-containing protein, partial [Myxococcota bacterium]|nr:MYXO-CTERM sorting domain-containing protein [Myxococcota bacterium]